jgi:hypothetical protein
MRLPEWLETTITVLIGMAIGLVLVWAAVYAIIA